MQYIAVMSLSGSILLVFCVLFFNRKIDFFPAGMADALLKGALVFLLVPMPFLAAMYREVSYWLPHAVIPEEGIFRDVYIKAVSTEGQGMVNNAYELQLVTLVIWLTTALFFLLVKTVCYLKRRNSLLMYTQSVTDTESLQLLTAIRKEYKIRRKIRLVDGNSRTFTTGVFRPVIFLQKGLSKTQLEPVLRHECMHIRRWDVLTKHFAAFAVCVHWFNPFVYILAKKLESTGELCCDAGAMANVGNEDRAEYAVLLLNSGEDKKMSFSPCSALSMNGKTLKRRLEYLMNPKQRTGKHMILAGLLAAVLIFLDSLTVLAYPDVKVEKLQSEDQFHPDAEVVFVVEGYESPYAVRYEILYDVQFTDEEGNIYQITNEGISTAELHTHKWVSGTVQKHIKTAGGGCIIYVYNAKRCLQCGYVELLGLINTVTSAVCTH